MNFISSRFSRISLLLALSIANPSGFAANNIPPEINEQFLKKRADSLLTLMSFTLLPDITTSTMGLSDDSADGTSEFFQTTLGGGFTISDDVPVYLEGTLGYSRYDPKYVFSDGSETRVIPTKWNSFSATGGIGYDFPVTENGEWVLRPIFNFMLGRVATDARLASNFLINNPELADLLDGSKMDAYGLGGAIMLDWEHYREDYEIDLELRYSNIQLKTFGSTSDGFKGSSATNSAGLWARYRAPTSYKVLNNPLRYVLETSTTSYYGDQKSALGFDRLYSMGAGIEIDSTDQVPIVTRTRLLIRYIWGENTSGTALGLSMSF